MGRKGSAKPSKKSESAEEVAVLPLRSPDIKRPGKHAAQRGRNLEWHPPKKIGRGKDSLKGAAFWFEVDISVAKEFCSHAIQGKIKVLRLFSHCVAAVAW